MRRPPRADGAVDVIRVDLGTGARTPVRTVTPVPGANSERRVGQLFVTADGEVDVQGYGVIRSELYLIKGLR